MFHGMQPHTVPRVFSAKQYPLQENEQPKKYPGFPRDFIILSEFSEQVGPVPIVSWDEVQVNDLSLVTEGVV